jgi:hypothetical protein
MNDEGSSLKQARIHTVYLSQFENYPNAKLNFLIEVEIDRSEP